MTGARMLGRLVIVIVGSVGWALFAAGHAKAETLRASWYGARGEYLNRRAADGSVFRPNALTAAHRSLPFGTRLRVTYGKRSIAVTVTDRGPARWTGRSLDLSRGAAAAIGLLGTGVARVSVQRLN